jgi:hypothetical protein
MGAAAAMADNRAMEKNFIVFVMNRERLKLVQRVTIR